jgi:hypothetical protein
MHTYIDNDEQVPSEIENDISEIIYTYIHIHINIYIYIYIHT